MIKFKRRQSINLEADQKWQDKWQKNLQTKIKNQKLPNYQGLQEGRKSKYNLLVK
jgi:hypothetical protein